jgi:hypothetical protein
MNKPGDPRVPASPLEAQEPLRGSSASQKALAKKEGPTATRTTREGASVGKGGHSTAGGAAGQVARKD